MLGHLSDLSKFMKSTLEKRILIFFFFVLALAIGANTAFNIAGFRQDYRDSLILRCQSVATELKSAVEKVIALGIPIDELEGINTRCQEIVGSDPEISYCLIENTVGLPLYSSDPSSHLFTGVQFYKTINESTAILITPKWGKVYDYSAPVFDASRRLAGRIRIGYPDSVLQARTDRAFQRSSIILGAAFLIVFILVFLFTRRDLVRPIRRLCEVAKEIAGGHFKVVVPAMSTPEFAELGTALQEMAASLQQRDEQLREKYRELEETNQELQLSYQRQEQIGTELGRSREMYRSLLEDASDAILVSNDEDHIVLINKAAESFFGIPREKVEGSNVFAFWEMLHCENIEAQYEMHQNILGGKFKEAEIRFVRLSDMNRLIAWANGSPVVGRDGRKMVQMTFRDVTREREIKENLETSTRELQRLNKMKDSFLGLASHELKTPLTVILGYSELLLDEYGSSIGEEELSLLKHISDAANRLSNIVRDMVDVSMLDSNCLRLRSRQADINDVVRQALKEIEFFFSVRNQTHRLRLADDLPLVSCDTDRMVQVITNLVINSIKFTPDGGLITVATRRYNSLRIPGPHDIAEMDEARPIGEELYPYIEICISDSGIGIAEDDQVHIFDKFYEVGTIEEHFTGKVAFKGKGTGLGLTIVKGIVDMHGGEIWVDSPGCDPDQCPGSTFHIILPLL